VTQKLEKIRDFCNECDGEGEVSECCQGGCDEHRCSECGRFCRTDVCHNCEGQGCTEYCLGDEVEVFVCVWSEEYLKDQLYRPKAVGDTKTYEGKLVEIVDNWNVRVRIPKKRKTVDIKLEDISTR